MGYQCSSVLTINWYCVLLANEFDWGASINWKWIYIHKGWGLFGWYLRKRNMHPNRGVCSPPIELLLCIIELNLELLTGSPIPIHFHKLLMDVRWILCKYGSLQLDFPLQIITINNNQISPKTVILLEKYREIYLSYEFLKRLSP